MHARVHSHPTSTIIPHITRITSTSIINIKKSKFTVKHVDGHLLSFIQLLFRQQKCIAASIYSAYEKVHKDTTNFALI